MNRRKELSKEVEQTKRAFAQQNSLTAVEQLKVENSIAEEQALLYQQVCARGRRKEKGKDRQNAESEMYRP